MTDLTGYKATINARLESLFSCVRDVPELLRESMRYSVMAGGKRLRGSMLLAAVDGMGGDAAEAVDFACAVEMIHTYSLIHDDLPGMDDDVMRRGRPTNHVVYGVGQAILAGDGLLNYAAELLLDCAARDESRALPRLAAMREIFRGAGITGMIAGQCLDLSYTARADVTDDMLRRMEYGKTGCMFVYPLRAACRLAGRADALPAFTEYGRLFGELFQATDDILDVTGQSAQLGKSIGKDESAGKATAVAQLGLDGARARCAELAEEAARAIEGIGDGARPFIALAREMPGRVS